MRIEENIVMQIEDILEKLDSLFKENKGEDAKQLLESAISQAKTEKDDAALLSLLNEMMGYMRETSRVEASYAYAGEALALVKEMGITGSEAHATTLLNAANAYRAGGRLKDSLCCYEEVKSLYEKLLPRDDMLFASLYNNISLLYQEMEEFLKAKESLQAALSIVTKKEGRAFEEAVTYANLAATCLRLDEDENAAVYFTKAISLFEENDIRDAHYAAALSAMGTYLYKKDDFVQAADCFTKAMEAMKASLGENDYYHRLEENLRACLAAMEKNEKEKPEAANGLALCRAYYETYGKPMIHEKFAAYENQIAVGLVGEGSDCFGYDDALSRDHDWGPGFCMWVSEELKEQIGEKLQAAYEALPASFEDRERRTTPQGQGRVGVCSIESFYGRILGKENLKRLDREMTAEDIDWAAVPDETLAAATNGQVFADKEGTFSAIRRLLKEGFPKRAQYLRLAESCARFSQAAQYNLYRMNKRGDAVASSLCVAEGLRHGMKILYYIDNTYPPHDKWLYEGLSKREDISSFTGLFSQITQAGTTERTAELFEELGSGLADRLYEKNLTGSREPYLEYHVREFLQQAVLCEQTEEELAAAIAEAEFDAFDKVRNVGGRASCQNDWGTFSIMRRSQYLTWEKDMLIRYLCDFMNAEEAGRNMIEEKYARMMESTAPEEYAEIAPYLPPISEEKKQIMEAIVRIQVGFMEEFAGQYPYLAANARTIHTAQDRMDDTSYETYLRGELGTYSDKMLEMYGRFVADLAKAGKNLAAMTMENSAKLYGYEGLTQAEAAERKRAEK